MKKHRRVRINVNRAPAGRGNGVDSYITVERIVDETGATVLRMRSWLNTRPPRMHQELTLAAHALPDHPHDALVFINGAAWKGAWPMPPHHRITEAWRDGCLRLLGAATTGAPA